MLSQLSFDRSSLHFLILVEEKRLMRRVDTTILNQQTIIAMIQIPSVPQYILESSISLMTFYALYYLLLRKDTYHHFNKYFLLSTALVSILLPFIDFNMIDATHKASSTIEPLIQYRADIKQYESGISNNMFYSITIGDILKGVFYVGLFLAALKFLYTLFQLLDRTKKVRSHALDRNANSSILGTTLFSFLFWSEDFNDEKGKQVIKNNMSKIRPWHCIDVIIIELLVVINWLNPLIYLFRNKFYQINEYIVDEKISHSYGGREEFAQELVKFNFDNKTQRGFSNSALLNRMMMLTKNRTSSMGKLKPLLVIPFTFVLMTLYSFDYAEKMPDELRSGLVKVEKSIEDASEHVVLNLTHSKRNYEWEFRWGKHLYGLTSKDEVGNLQYDLSKEVSLFDLYESIGSTPSYKTKGVYESMGFDIKITSNSDTVSNISVPIGSYESLESKMKNEISKHKTPFSIYFSNIGSSNDKRDRGFMIKVFQYLKVDKEEESQDEVREVKAKWGDLDLEGVDYGWIMNSNNGFKSFGNFTRFGSSQEPFIVTKDDFLNKVNSNFSLMVNDKEMLFNEDVMLVMKIRRSEMVQSRKDWNPDAENISTAKGARSVKAISKVYHGRTMSRVEDDYDFKEVLNGGDEYVISVLESVTNDDVITIAAIDTLDTSEQGNHYFFSMTIKEKDAAYKSPYEVELPPTSDTYNNFQIYYNAEDDQTYVKVDTTALGNENIVRAYRHSESYQLTHVPNFKTKNRVNDKRVLPGGTLNIDPKMNLTTSVLKMEKLNEHYTDSDRMIRLDWGKMVSLPGIGNFSRKEFRRSSLSNILLSAGDNFLNVERFDMVIIAQNSEPIRVRTDNIKSENCRKILREIEGTASIYFDNIIINDGDEFKYYPYQFVFNVE